VAAVRRQIGTFCVMHCTLQLSVLYDRLPQRASFRNHELHVKDRLLHMKDTVVQVRLRHGCMYKGQCRSLAKNFATV